MENIPVSGDALTFGGSCVRSRMRTALASATNTHQGLTQSSGTSRERAEMNHISAVSDKDNLTASKPRRYGPRIKPGDPCVECSHPMRAKNARATDHPGTKEHYGRGLCSRCYFTALRERNKASRAEPVTDPPEPKPAPDPVLHIYLQHDNHQDQYNAEMMRAFILERRARGVPEEGTGWREEE